MQGASRRICFTQAGPIAAAHNLAVTTSSACEQADPDSWIASSASSNAGTHHCCEKKLDQQYYAAVALITSLPEISSPSRT